MSTDNPAKNINNLEPKCDCYEDCNGIWGIPNQDLCHGCCWSVGDKVKYTHDWRGSFQIKWGGATAQTPFCATSDTCGRLFYDGMEDGKIQVEYVCIGARGLGHSAGNNPGFVPEDNDGNLADIYPPASDPRLPKFSPVRSWGRNPGAFWSNDNDGWNRPQIIALPLCPKQPLDPFGKEPPKQCPGNQCCCDGIDIQSNYVCGDIEYVPNIANVPGCVRTRPPWILDSAGFGRPSASGWPWKFPNDYFIEFIAKQSPTGSGFFWHPVIDPKYDPSATDYMLSKVSTPRTCCCGEENELFCPCMTCALGIISGNEEDDGWIRACIHHKWNADTDDPVLMFDTSDFCICVTDPVSGKRVKGTPSGGVDEDGNPIYIPTDQPCNCWNDETAVDWNDPCDPDPAPWPYGPSGPIPDCPSCKRRYRINRTAVIFALNLENEDIQYCGPGQADVLDFNGEIIQRADSTPHGTKSSNGGVNPSYWIEGKIKNKWFKYELSPFLVMACKPILEWECNCKDEEGNDTILVNEVCESVDCTNSGKKKEIAGGYDWFGWNGNCTPFSEGDPCKGCGFRSISSCVASCITTDNEFAGFGVSGKDISNSSNSNLVPARTEVDCDDGNSRTGIPWIPFNRPGSAPVLSGESTQTFFLCQDCGESVASCHGYKSYCVRREQTRPNRLGTGGCSGECDGFYGEAWKRTNLWDLQECTRIEATISAKCSVGVQVDIDNPPSAFGQCCSAIYCQYQGSNWLVPRTADNPNVPESVMRSRCVAMFVQTLEIEPVEDDVRRCSWYEWTKNGKQRRCCGKPKYTGPNDVDKDGICNVSPPVSLSEGNIFPNGYTFSWTEGFGSGEGWPNRGEAQQICQNIIPPGSACDCNAQPQCGGSELTWRNPGESSPCNLAICHRFACMSSNVRTSSGCVVGGPDCKWNSSPKSFVDEEDRPELPENCVYTPEGDIECEYTNPENSEETFKEVYYAGGAGARKNIGCSCVPPACSCCLRDFFPDSGNVSCGPGRYNSVEIGKCNPDNYKKLWPFPCYGHTQIPPHSGCQNCLTDISGCTYKGCEQDFSCGPPCPGGLSFCGHGSLVGKCPNYCECEGSGPIVTPTGWYCSTCDEVCEGEDDSVPLDPIPSTTFSGKITFNGNPIPNIIISNDADENETLTDSEGNFTISIAIPFDRTNINIFLFGYIDNQGFVGGSYNTSKEDPLIYWYTPLTTINLGEIEIQDIDTEINYDDFCVKCGYKCPENGDCPDEISSCIVSFTQPILEQNCPSSQIISCPSQGGPTQQCMGSLDSFELVVCNSTNNPQNCS